MPFLSSQSPICTHPLLGCDLKWKVESYWWERLFLLSHSVSALRSHDLKTYDRGFLSFCLFCGAAETPAPSDTAWVSWPPYIRQYVTSSYPAFKPRPFCRYLVKTSSEVMIISFVFSGSDIYCEILDERPKSGLLRVCVHVFCTAATVGRPCWTFTCLNLVQ